MQRSLLFLCVKRQASKQADAYHILNLRRENKKEESSAVGGETFKTSPQLITLADMDNNMGRFEGSLQEMAKSN